MGNHINMRWSLAFLGLWDVLLLQTYMQEEKEEGWQKRAQRSCRPQKCTVTGQLYQRKGEKLTYLKFLFNILSADFQNFRTASDFLQEILNLTTYTNYSASNQSNYITSFSC